MRNFIEKELPGHLKNKINRRCREMEKAIVTGGCGFIGSHLADFLLEKGHYVKVIDNLSCGNLDNIKQHQSNHNMEFHKLDISDYNNNSKLDKIFQNVDWVFHLAALADIVPSINNPIKYHKANVDGTINVLEASRKNDVKRFIYTASSSCYGIPDEYPTKEIAEIRPQYPYALTKRLGEELVLHWAQTYKLPAVSLRFFNVYGPRSRTSGTYGAVFGVFMAQKLAGKPFTIVGDGYQTRDFSFVSDVCNAMLMSAEHGRSGEVYNVGSGKTVSVNRIAELLGGDKVFIPKRPSEPDCTFAEISKIIKDTGWGSKVSIEEGVKLLLENIDYWRDAPVWDPESIKAATSDWFKYLG